MIKSDGTPDEEDSPFFQANKSVCVLWDELITNAGGKVRGKYTAWALFLVATHQNHYDWKITVRKSTSTNGSLWIPNRSLVFQQTHFLADNAHLGKSDFVIRKMTLADRMKESLGFKATRVTSQPTYILFGSDRTPPIDELIELLAGPLGTGDMHTIRYTADTAQLSIDIRSLDIDEVLAHAIINFGSTMS